MYTLEERIEQPQANKETQGTGKKKKKKRKKVNCQNENKPPHEEQNDAINHQNSKSTSFYEVGRSSTQVTGCEWKTAGMVVEGSVKCESLAVQPIIDAQTGKGTIAPYKDSSVLDFYTLGDHSQQDISMDTPDEDSLTPSAEALSAALHASALSLDDDGRFLLTVDQTDEFSSEKCGNNLSQKPSIELLEKNESASTVTELKLKLSVCATDCSSEGSGDYNPSSSASNTGVVDSKDTTGSQLSKLCKDKNKQLSDSNDREMDSRGEKNIDKTDLDPFPSNIVNLDVSFVGVDEILPSTTEGSSHSVVTDGKENECYDRLQENSCRINMENNCDDVTVGDRLLVKDEKDIVMNEQKQEFTKMEHNDQLYNLIREDCSKENREIAQNTESSSNSGTTLQTVSIFSESKSVMTKESEKEVEKCDFIEDGLLPDKSDSTEQIALVGSGKEKSEDAAPKGGKEGYLEHSTIREERPSTQGFKLHSVTVPCSALNETQQVERKSVESNIEVVQNEDQTRNVRFNALLLGGACDEEKSLSNLHEVTLRFTVDSDTCEDTQRPLELLCTDKKTDSSCGALTFSGENPPFRNEEGVVSSLICVDGTSEIEGKSTLDRAAARTSVASDQSKNSPNEALKIPMTVTNNVDMRDEENRLFDFEAPEVVSYVPDENEINLERQHKEAEAVLIDVESAALMSNSDENLSQGGSLRSGVNCLVSNSEGLYLGSSDCDQTTVENSSGVCIIEPCRKVDESPDDRKSEMLQPAQSEPCCGDVKVATLYSDTIEASDMSVNLGMTQERNSLRTKAFDASWDRDSVTVSPEGSMESAFKVPGKENNAKNEPFSELFKNHANSSEMKTEDDYPSVRGTCGDCRKVTVTEDTKLQNDERLQNTVFENKDNASEVEKEEGEVGSHEVDMLEAKSRETEEEKTLDAQKTRSEDNVETPKAKSKETLETEKLKEEEKEEGELSSSDSDAEVFVKIADAQKGGPSTSKSKLFDDRMVASAVDKQLHPARRHSSGEGHHTFTMERSRLLASLGGKRRGPSSAIANADLRTRLSEIRSQRTSCGNAKSGAPRFEESVKECDGTEKRSKKVKEKVPHRGKNGKSKVKGGRNVDVKDSRLKTREAQNNSTKTGSVKEDNHLGGLPKKEQLRQTPQSSKKAPQNSQGSSPCNTNSKTENTGGNKADFHPDNVQRTAAESDGKNRLKISQPESRRKTKGTRKTSTRSEDSAAVVTKDVKKDSTGRHTPNSHPDMAKKSTSKNALKTTQPESCPKTLNAESNSSDTKKTDLKGKTGGRTLRSSGTPKSASGSSVERPSKRHSMNKATLKDQPTLVGHPLSTGKGTLKGCRQVDRSCGRQTTSESKKLFNVKGGKRLAATDGNVSKVEYNEKGELQSVNVPSRTVPRKVSNKRLVNVTSKEKANPERGMEIRPQNPRKRRRSVDSTEINHGKKIRIDEVKDSLSKPSTVSSTHKLPKDSKRIPDYTSNSINVPSCGDINVEGSRKVPANMENFKQTVKPKRDGDSKADDDIQAKTISIGHNKCLVFKRRHVNQLFVRGDNVAMVAYAK